jgi:hypothetical protein
MSPLDTTICDETEITTTNVAPHVHSPRMLDRDPLPAPRKARRGVAITSALMGDPSCRGINLSRQESVMGAYYEPISINSILGGKREL